ncbi:MAG: hypothetical protein ACETVU_02085 [Desulfatiglandales bacterium]
MRVVQVSKVEDVELTFQYKLLNFFSIPKHSKAVEAVDGFAES